MSELYEALSAAPALNVIPESCLSFSEQASFIAEFAKHEYTKMMESIGIDELLYYEVNESVVLYEGEKADALKEKIKTLMTKIFGSIKALFTNIKKYFDSKTRAAKALKISNNILDNIPEGTIIGKTHTFYDFNKVKFGEKAIKYGKEVDKTFKGLAGSPKEDIKKACNMLEEKIIVSVTGINATKFKEMKAIIRQEMTGQEVNVDKAWLKKNFKHIQDVIYGGKIDKDIKTAYNAEKDAMNTMFATIESVDGDPEFVDVIPMWCGCIEDIIIAAMYGYSYAFDVYKRMLNEYITLLIKAQKISNKNKKAVKEEVQFNDALEESSYTKEYDLVISMFDF